MQVEKQKMVRKTPTLKKKVKFTALVKTKSNEKYEEYRSEYEGIEEKHSN